MLEIDLKQTDIVMMTLMIYCKRCASLNLEIFYASMFPFCIEAMFQKDLMDTVSLKIDLDIRIESLVHLVLMVMTKTFGVNLI